LHVRGVDRPWPRASNNSEIYGTIRFLL